MCVVLGPSHGMYSFLALTCDTNLDHLLPKRSIDNSLDDITIMLVINNFQAGLLLRHVSSLLVGSLPWAYVN